MSDEPHSVDDQGVPKADAAEILNRLTTLEASLQQIRIMVESLAGNVGSIPSTLVSVIGSINSLTTGMNHLSHLTTMHAGTVGNLAVSAGNILTHASAMTEMRSAMAQPSCAAPTAMFDAQAFAMESALPGEVGHI